MAKKKVKKKATKKYVVLSPDGFTIHPTDTYKSRVAASKATREWVERYRTQGYYSCRGERIDLDDLPNRCRLVDENDKLKLFA
jgi:hypothetical protein